MQISNYIFWLKCQLPRIGRRSLVIALLIYPFFNLSIAGTETGCKSFAADGYNIFYSNIGTYQGDALYSRTGNQYLFSDIRCLQATGAGCFIQLTAVNECNNGCNTTPDANGYYYKPGTEYNFDPVNPQAFCDLDTYGLIALLIMGCYGFSYIRKNL
ncbi:hypothetical protein CA265_11915 [Sphingobacteriaceae bacterium GW460-11-11-14-LB5]|nr:hypothetical protein CA265_11915 [Sphingobacteriaceae bacterium GW460-11-11-14-LB5]